ncbi:unnamed protein product, partial [Prorocentrum cordatum]
MGDGPLGPHSAGIRDLASLFRGDHGALHVWRFATSGVPLRCSRAAAVLVYDLRVRHDDTHRVHTAFGRRVDGKNRHSRRVRGGNARRLRSRQFPVQQHALLPAARHTAAGGGRGAEAPPHHEAHSRQEAAGVDLAAGGGPPEGGDGLQAWSLTDSPLDKSNEEICTGSLDLGIRSWRRRDGGGFRPRAFSGGGRMRGLQLRALHGAGRTHPRAPARAAGAHAGRQGYECFGHPVLDPVRVQGHDGELQPSAEEGQRAGRRSRHAPAQRAPGPPPRAAGHLLLGAGSLTGFCRLPKLHEPQPVHSQALGRLPDGVHIGHLERVGALAVRGHGDVLRGLHAPHAQVRAQERQGQPPGPGRGGGPLVRPPALRLRVPGLLAVLGGRLRAQLGAA